MALQVKKSSQYEATEFGGKAGLDNGAISEGQEPTTIQRLQGMIANDPSDPAALVEYDPERVGRPDRYMKKDWRT